MLRSIGDLALTELLPHLGCRVGQDGIDERGNDADGLGRCRQHAGLQCCMFRFAAVGGLFPGSIGGEVAVGFGDEDPQGFQRLREIQFVESRSELGDRARRAFAQRGLAPRSPHRLPAQLRQSTCAPC